MINPNKRSLKKYFKKKIIIIIQAFRRVANYSMSISIIYNSIKRVKLHNLKKLTVTEGYLASSLS